MSIHCPLRIQVGPEPPINHCFHTHDFCSKKYIVHCLSLTESLSQVIPQTITVQVVLAYSGGLDTSIILKWLVDVYGCEVVTFTADLGQVGCCYWSSLQGWG